LKFLRIFEHGPFSFYSRIENYVTGLIQQCRRALGLGLQPRFLLEPPPHTHPRPPCQYLGFILLLARYKTNEDEKPQDALPLTNQIAI
jgi:hypothetical protein